MATMIEKQIAKANKDIEKYTKAINRHSALLEKRTAKCNTMNCNWTFAEWVEHREAKTYTDDQYWAWVDMRQSEKDLEEAKKHLEQTERHLDKLTGKAEEKAAENAESERMTEMENRWWSAINEELKKSPEQRKAEYEAWLKEFKAECARDGIIIDEANNNRITGTTPKGKGFGLWINEGYTQRSWHCYSLNINGNGIFTSGEFKTAYRYIKNS